MATQVQFRRGTTTQNNAFTGAVGELTYDTEIKTLRIHDGSTPGGGTVVLTNSSSQTATNKTFSTGSVWNGSPVALAYGGTGAALTAVAGAVAYSTGSALALSAAGTSGQILISGGTGAPTWVNASSVTAGTATNATYATNINGGSAGQLVIQQDTGLTTFITAGASGTFLRSAGAGYAPTWATSNITIGSTAIDLGSSSTSLAGLNILAATGTSHWTLPVGTTAQRPGTPATGMIRYNSSISSFEGYSSGAWSSLGGVKSVDALTYIIAETSAGASNGDLDFYAEDAAGTAATQVGQWNRTNLKDYTGTIVGTQTTQNVFNATATTVNAFGAATSLTLGQSGGTTTLRSSVLVGSNTTQNVFNTTATTVNAFGAATTVSLGASSGTTTVNNNLTVTGNLTVNGTTTTVNSTTVTVDDIVMELGAVATPTDTTANGGGISLLGATNKTILWDSTNTNWTSSEHWNIASGKSFKIANTNVLDASTVLGAATSATVAGAATTLTIGATSGTATIRNATVAITNAATVGSTLGVTGATTLSSTLGVTGATTLSSTLAVTSTSTFTGKATMNGGADIVDAIAFDYNFTGTTSSTTATAMTSFASATYRSGKLLMQVVNGTAYRILELLFVHDGTTVTLSENYAVANEIQTGATNTTFSASIATGTLTVYATASSGTSVIKGHATLFKV